MRFKCGRFKVDDNSMEGRVMVVDSRTDIEIKRIDCRTPQGRRELFEFIMEWARANPEIKAMGYHRQAS